MRKSLWIIWLLFVAALVPIARADSYTYSFVGAGSTAGTDFTLVDNSGPLTFGTWITAPLLKSLSDIFIEIAGVFVDEGPITSVQFVTNVCNVGGVNYNGVSISSNGGGDVTECFADPNLISLSATGVYGVEKSGAGGYMTIASVATPEPATVCLLMLGLGLVVAINGLGLSRTS